MISVTFNTSVTHLTFTINSRRYKNEIATTFVATYLEQSQGGNMAAQRTECVRVSTALTDTCWSD